MRKIKFCVSNFDLHAGSEREEEFFEKLMACKKESKNLSRYEKIETHCLGYCYWCQQGPIAVVDQRLIRRCDR